MEEKRAWIMIVVSVTTYAIYVSTLLHRAQDMPLADVPYVGAMIKAVITSIIATIVLSILVSIVSGIASGGTVDKKDQRDREINRFGEYTGQSFVIAGAVAAMVMAMADLDTFWIANVIYLAFTLSALLSSVAKIVAYRKGFHPW